VIAGPPADAQVGGVTHRLVLVSIAVAGAVAFGYATLHVEADAPAPARLAWAIPHARTLVREGSGLAALVPFRFVEARCDGDGNAALLFESRGGFRLYAYVSAPPPTRSPDMVQIVRAMPASEYADSAFSRETVSCGTATGARVVTLASWRPSVRGS
jgi:hypothetical protein